MVPSRVLDTLIEFTQAAAAEQLSFLIELSNQNSYTYNKHGTDSVAELLLGKFDHLFSTHRVFEQADCGNHHLLSNAAGEKSIHLLGHMDTVFPPDHEFRECCVDGDLLRGPGCGDMKAGLATIVYAVLALHEADVLRTIPLTVVLGSDEEAGSVTSRPVHEAARENALCCLVVEGGGQNGEVVVSRNGKMGARLDCHGRDRHVGAGNHEKSSAILELAHKTIALEGLNGCLPGVSLNVGKVKGGLGPATVAAAASAQLDVRWREQEHRDRLIEEIGALVSAEDLVGCWSELTTLNERPAMSANEENRQLAAIVQRAGEALGQSFGQEHRGGTSDANFYGSNGVPTLDGLGPVCNGYHTPGEYVEIPSIKQRTALLAYALTVISSQHDGASRADGVQR